VHRGWQRSLAALLTVATPYSPWAQVGEDEAPSAAALATDLSRCPPKDISFLLKGKGVPGCELQLQSTPNTTHHAPSRGTESAGHLVAWLQPRCECTVTVFNPQLMKHSTLFLN